jgi:hypothetical protein
MAVVRLLLRCAAMYMTAVANCEQGAPQQHTVEAAIGTADAAAAPYAVPVGW